MAIADLCEQLDVSDKTFYRAVQEFRDLYHAPILLKMAYILISKNIITWINMQQDIIELLRETDLLGDVPVEIMRSLDPAPEWMSISLGETLITQGDEGQAFYLLVHGRLRVFVTDRDGIKRQVREIFAGEGVGEMSLLTDDRTSASVRATHDCDLIRFSRDSYKQLMKTSPEAAMQMTRSVIHRLSSGRDGHKNKLAPISIAIIPIDTTVDTTRFVIMLNEQLSHFASTSIVNIDDLGASYGHLMRGTEQISLEINREITNKLKMFDAENIITLYPSDYEVTEWTRICVRNADLVLTVGSVDSKPALTNVESSLLKHQDKDLAASNELVLLHPEEWRQNCDTDHWIETRNITEFHHLRTWRATDFARLARMLTGNEINLVLGGGGSRGFAQIGVLRALTEAGIPIDRIAGTSMGSFIGALFAQEQSTEAITKTCRKVWIEGKPLSDYTFPLISLVRGQRLHNLVKNTFNQWKIENLPVRFFCVSSNLSSADTKLHERGTLWEGVRASGSLPGAGPPMFLQGNILVDGGVLDNLPCSFIFERYKGAVIAVDVSLQTDFTVSEDFDEVPSGWRLMLNKINPFEQKIKLPNIFQILHRTATLSSDRLAKQMHDRVDLLLTPPVGEFSITSFTKLDKISEIGYQYTVAQLRGKLDPRIARYMNTEKQGNKTSI